MNAYDGYEELSSFTSEELQAYRNMLLDKTKPQVEFIKRHIGKSSVVDLGCGNGRLVIAGYQAEIFYCDSIGTDISASRVAFAQQWAKDTNSKVQFLKDDITKLTPSWSTATTLVTCITGCPNYFDEDDLLKVLTFMRKQPHMAGGKSILEFYRQPVDRMTLLAMNDWKLKTWYELPPEDKFRYYLEDFEYDPDKHKMTHGKVFIGRDGTIDAGRTETLYYYTGIEVRLLLTMAGFKKAEVYGGWNDEPYNEDVADKMVVIAHA